MIPLPCRVAFAEDGVTERPRNLVNPVCYRYDRAPMSEDRPAKRTVVVAPVRTMFTYETQPARLFDPKTVRELRDRLDAIDAAQQRADAASRDAFIS
jgi:hypothetical protein